MINNCLTNENLNKINYIENNEDEINYEELEKLRKKIELLNNTHHIYIGKLLKNNNVKLTENKNGIFINMNNLSKKIINNLYEYIDFIEKQDIIVKNHEEIIKVLEEKFFNN